MDSREALDFGGLHKNMNSAYPLNYSSFIQEINDCKTFREL